MITIIEGPQGSGKTTLANSLRNQHIGKGLDEKSKRFHGALLIDEDQDGEPRHLLEKLIEGMALPANETPILAKAVPWKADPQVIIVGSKQEKLLDKFEKLVPGFKEKVGPVKRLKLSNA